MIHRVLALLLTMVALVGCAASSPAPSAAICRWSTSSPPC